MKYYIIAGEASGDLHGSNLVRALLGRDADGKVRCWGGDLMEAAGGHLVRHYRDLAFMGFVEVVRNMRTIFRNLAFCKKDILQYRPDVLILIDYPGFNLRMAAWARAQGFKVVYYIAPQVWAWKENRVPAMKRNIDKMLVILPFEKEYFRTRWDWEVEYVGHPLVEEIDKYQSRGKIATSIKPFIALIPGSRRQEILKKLPIMLQVAQYFPQYDFIVSKAPSLDDALYQNLMQDYANVQLAQQETYYLMQNAAAALVTSGTATLETALFATPEIVCYKGSKISYQIAKRLIKIKYISLVNLIMDKLVVKELIQENLKVENCVAELKKLLSDQEAGRQLQKDYAALRAKLSAGGNASENAASSILQWLRSGQ